MTTLFKKIITKKQKATSFPLNEYWKDIGRHEVQWQGQDHSGRPVATGMYFTVLSDGNKIIVQKMLLLK